MSPMGLFIPPSRAFLHEKKCSSLACSLSPPYLPYCTLHPRNKWMLYLIHSNFLYVTCCLLHCSPYLYLPSARNAVGRRRVSEIRATCTANSRRVQSKFSTHTIRPDMHRKPAPRPVGARLTSSESEPTMGPRASSPVTHSTHGVISLPTPPPPTHIHFHPHSANHTRDLGLLDRASSWLLNKERPTRCHLLYYFII